MIRLDGRSSLSHFFLRWTLPQDVTSHDEQKGKENYFFLVEKRARN